MKAILYTFLLFVLCSCGGSGKNGSSNNKQSSNELSSKISKEIECLERKLGWIATPPRDHYEVMRFLEKQDFDTCGASNEALEIYSQRVLDINPNFNH